MQDIQAKTQQQVVALQNEAQKAANKLNEEVVTLAKGIQHIQTQAGIAYQLNPKDVDTKKTGLIAKKVDNDLEVVLEESIIIFDNYFTICETDLSCLVSLPIEDGGLYHIVADAFFTLEDGTQVVYFYGKQFIVATESSAVISTDDNQSFSDVITSNIGIVAAVVVVAVVVAVSGSDSGDTTAPELTFTLANDTGSSDSDNIISNGAITVIGLEEGVVWQYSINGGTNWVNGTGNSFTLDEGTYNVDAIQIKQTDAAGNTSSVVKNTSAIIVDTTPPTAPIFSFTDTGSLGNDNITNNGTITVTGLEEDATWQYSINGGTDFTNGTGNSFTLNEGTYNVDAIQIKQTDVAGNTSSVVKNVFVIVVDTTLPTAPIFSFTDTGSLSNDNITNNGTITVTGLEEDATWQYSINGGTDFTNGTGNSFTLNEDIYGVNTIQIKQIDVAGNTSSVIKNTSAIVVDTTPLTAPIFSFTDTGSLDNDNITNNGTITVTGLKEDATWQYSINGGTDFTNGTGNSFTLNEGTYGVDAMQIKQTDIAGNASIVKNTSTIVVDTSDPLFTSAATADLEINTTIETVVYDAQASNLSSGGNADDGITYHIKNANTSKFAITADTGIVTYKTIQTTVHNDTVNIIATDVAGNTTDQTVVVSVITPIFVQGFVINGQSAGDYSGRSVSLAGDVNGDGLDDLIIGANEADPYGKTDAGKSYVVFGKSDGAVANLSDIALGTGGFVINGEKGYDLSGTSVSSAGDINGDGLDDLIIGANKADPDGRTDAGKSYVVFGKSDGVVANLSALGTGGFVINGENIGDWSGHSVSSAGDVNGDGLGDLIVGASYASLSNKNSIGKSYVVFGKADKTAVNLSTIVAGTGGFVINGENIGDHSGFSVSSAGDVNGDGLDDLIVGAPYANFGDKTDAGKSYVVFGKIGKTAVNLSTMASDKTGFVINGENAGDYNGISVSSAGDVNGDGLDDLIVGACRADPNGRDKAGKSFVVFGKVDVNAVNLSTIAAGTGGFVINGENAADWSGYSVSSAGDVNGDGLDDLIVGVKEVGTNSKGDVSKSYVVFGKVDVNAVNLSTIAAGTGGFVINGENAGDRNGTSVSSAGDVNGDGLDDLIVGAYQAGFNNKDKAGKSFVVFGKTDTEAVNLTDISAGKGSIVHAIDFQGDDANNTLTGASVDELFVAGLGDDILTGNGGTDVFNAGKGNDTIVINADNLAKLYSKVLSSHLLARVDGGGNTDTLKLAGANLNLDLTRIDSGRIQDIEIIDLTGSGDNTLKLNLNDLLDISSTTNVLKVIGNSGDEVEVTGFSKSSVESVDGVVYDVYSNANASTAKLWVDQELAII
ncbi:beta strand repeat-containing protein [Bathymodiolus thermophilus thioautotrophic gill symbiont]|uniref:Alpha integrin n=2 Tax=Bathymodiolus thermophilus thioautotrophic gill symbiont TaxID=2360 RepID=A0A8H8XCW0_9GAMM|nr:FG-GAP repeat protein [Bathymodiolus thermophilus thioautotrophic gill symbiont]CAB5504767.1 hypothetical protein THERMOS_2014 [Bathymodiolus thermophilus thioautotrophic gill symbiont]